MMHYCVGKHKNKAEKQILFYNGKHVFLVIIYWIKKENNLPTKKKRLYCFMIKKLIQFKVYQLFKTKHTYSCKHNSLGSRKTIIYRGQSSNSGLFTSLYLKCVILISRLHGRKKKNLTHWSVWNMRNIKLKCVFLET
jgi:hypothetical protein